MLKPRIIKKKDCARCAAYIQHLDLMKVEYLTYDVEEGNTADLDKWHINDLPIVQIVDENGEVRFQFLYSKNGWSPRSIRYKIAELEKQK